MPVCGDTFLAELPRCKCSCASIRFTRFAFLWANFLLCAMVWARMERCMSAQTNGGTVMRTLQG